MQPLQSGERTQLTEAGGRLIAATVYERFAFTHAEVRLLRKWHRLKFGVTINDRRVLCREFLAEAIKNQWLLVDVESDHLDPERPPPPD